MNLLDPKRPRDIQARPLLECGLAAPKLELIPVGGGYIEVSAWLPVVGEDRFVSKRFVAAVKNIDLIRVLGNYETNPEVELERLFFAVGEGQLLPEVRRLRRPAASLSAVNADEIEV